MEEQLVIKNHDKRTAKMYYRDICFRSIVLGSKRKIIKNIILHFFKYVIGNYNYNVPMAVVQDHTTSYQPTNSSQTSASKYHQWTH